MGKDLEGLQWVVGASLGGGESTEHWLRVGRWYLEV